MHEFRRKQREARENFVENVLRQMQKTGAHDGNQPHEMSRQAEANRANQDGSRSTPDLIRDPYHHINSSQPVTGKHVAKDQSGPIQGEQGEKKPAANSKDSKLLNELSMKQIDSMSRTRTKCAMMNTKTDAKVPRPSLNQLKLTQQQQMVSGNASNPLQQNAKAGSSLMNNSHPSNSLVEVKQISEPTKSDYWMGRPGDPVPICTSIDSVVGYHLSNLPPSAAKVPYTTHPSQGGHVMQPPVTQYPVTHLPVTCGTQSSMSVVAGHESAPSTSFASGHNDPWYSSNSLK